MGCVPSVIDGRVTIVDFEELLACHLHDLFCGDSPSKIGMIEVEDHGLSGFLPLLGDGFDVLLHDFDDAVSSLRLDGASEVTKIHVNRGSEISTGDLFAGN